MSRSYKKTPYYGDRKGHDKKRFANKIVRGSKNIMNGSFYKKLYCSYNICDWFRKKTWNEYINEELSDYKSYINGNCSGVNENPELKKDKIKFCWYKKYCMK